jgi:hypothetical protein
MLTDAEMKAEKERIVAQLWMAHDIVENLVESIYGNPEPDPREDDLADHLGHAHQTISGVIDEIEEGELDRWLRDVMTWRNERAAKAGK